MAKVARAVLREGPWSTCGSCTVWAGHLDSIPAQPSLLSAPSPLCSHWWKSHKTANSDLDLGCLRTWFQRWRDCSRRSAQQRLQLERAVQHHRRQLLLEGLARWKMHHLECVRKRVRPTVATLQVPPAWQGVSRPGDHYLRKGSLLTALHAAGVSGGWFGVL